MEDFFTTPAESTKPKKSKKFQLNAVLFREDPSAKKEWFGYLTIPESEFQGLADALREAPRVASSDGRQSVRFKIAGWNRQTHGKPFISMAIDDI